MSYHAHDALDDEQKDAIIGMTLQDAHDSIEGFKFVAGSINGEPQAVTMDYVPFRVRVELQDDIIVGIIGYG